jgi:hypothetical protein
MEYAKNSPTIVGIKSPLQQHNAAHCGNECPESVREGVGFFFALAVDLLLKHDGKCFL